MKRMLWVIVVLAGALLAACGPSAPPIPDPAADMNLALADLPPGFAPQGADLGMVEILARVNLGEGDKGAVQDANMRTFVSTPDVTVTAGLTDTTAVSKTQVVAAVLRFDSEGSAQSGAGEIGAGWGDAFKNKAEVTPAALTAPQLGTAAQFSRVDMPGQKAQSFLLVIQKRNVVGFVLVTGPAGQVEELARSLGQAMDAKIRLPATPTQ